MENRCPRCGVERVESEKDTSSGEEVRTLSCPACGYSSIRRGGQALWSVLSDFREWEEALKTLSGRLAAELPGCHREQLEEGLRRGGAEFAAALGRIAERRAKPGDLDAAGELLRQMPGEEAVRELDRLGLLLARGFFAAIRDPASAQTPKEDLVRLPFPCWKLCFEIAAREALLAADGRGELPGFMAQFLAATPEAQRSFADPEFRRSFGSVLAALARERGGSFAAAARDYAVG